jgi:hypothetical protein
MTNSEIRLILMVLIAVGFIAGCYAGSMAILYLERRFADVGDEAQAFLASEVSNG